MLSSSQLGNPAATYGNIQLGGNDAPLYVWGAWEVIGHYQPPLTSQEEAVIERRIEPEPVFDNTETIRRLQAEARHNEIAHAPVAKAIRRMKPKKYDDDDESFFIMM